MVGSQILDLCAVLAAFVLTGAAVIGAW